MPGLYRFDEAFRPHVGAEVCNVEAAALQHRRDDVLADVVEVALDCADDDAARRLVAQADTFYIATAHPRSDASTRAQGVDVSHRGGKPGFVRVEGDVLTVPDFIGNHFFNTLGNLLLHPPCGLLFIDFETGDLLQLAARGEVVTSGEALRGFAGAQRLLRLEVLSLLRREGALPLRWGEAELSPHLVAMGEWS